MSPDQVVSEHEKPLYAMLNILDVGFMFIATFTFITGYFIKQYERHLPAFIIQTYKYGSFAHDGVGDKFVTSTEIPKAFYKHFYAFSSVLSVITLLYALCVYFLDFSVNGICVYMLSLLLEQEKPSVSVGAALLTLTLIVIQSLRRYYETFFLQVFSDKAKMNLSHYAVGFVHYFGVIVAAIGEAPLFCGEQDRSQILWMDTKTKILALPITVLFALLWWEQYQSNIILANLRRDTSGAVVSQEYKIPHGRLFNYVSSPHRFCEVMLYLLLLILTPTKTYLFIFMWVLSNQLFSALLAHSWYVKKFEDYPKNRKAIFPGVL
ncbi:polyprenol reductase-like [Aricia agestis]|uniref:polyprenol reductase-like n=1 Tax=Aricia agestis TaxID=91739 RepID=UPI001C206804|nr:polyprenol reductase-like [Aricia agestis]